LRAEARALMSGTLEQRAAAGREAAALEPAYRAMLERAAQLPVPMSRRLDGAPVSLPSTPARSSS
jgi:hypothetical protein